MSLTVLLKGGPQFVVTEVHNICEGTKGLIITVRHDILPELRDRATPLKDTISSAAQIFVEQKDSHHYITILLLGITVL